MVDNFSDNIPFVHYWAQRYHVADVDYDDLVQEGMIGLMEASKKYDPQKGSFISYAFPWIRGHMLDALEDSLLIKLPGDVYKEAQKFRKTRNKLIQFFERDPTFMEVAEHLGLSESEMAVLQNLPSVTMRLDIGLGDKHDQPKLMQEFFGEEDPDYTGFNDVLNFRLDELPVRLRVVINMRYGLNGKPQRSLKECGKILGVSYEWVRHIENEALHYLKALKDA